MFKLSHAGYGTKRDRPKPLPKCSIQYLISSYSLSQYLAQTKCYLWHTASKICNPTTWKQYLRTTQRIAKITYTIVQYVDIKSSLIYDKCIYNFISRSTVTHITARTNPPYAWCSQAYTTNAWDMQFSISLINDILYNNHQQNVKPPLFLINRKILKRFR